LAGTFAAGRPWPRCHLGNVTMLPFLSRQLSLDLTQRIDQLGAPLKS
jgi:hypothetical protein